MKNIENKFPGKDISKEDIKTKFPLCAKKNKSHKSKFKIAGVEFGGKNIPIFAGPNMVESKRLIMDIAKNVKKNGAHFLRGGAFKPLTFPYRSKKYTETRESGIQWLKEAKKKYKIPSKRRSKPIPKRMSFNISYLFLFLQKTFHKPDLAQ